MTAPDYSGTGRGRGGAKARTLSDEWWGDAVVEGKLDSAKSSVGTDCGRRFYSNVRQKHPDWLNFSSGCKSHKAFFGRIALFLSCEAVFPKNCSFRRNVAVGLGGSNMGRLRRTEKWSDTFSISPFKHLKN
jgi:hypothetical protein